MSMYYLKQYEESYCEEIHMAIEPIVKALKEASCTAVVETSPPIGGQNVKLLKMLSDSTDMHIIPCTGWNIPKYLYDLFPKHFTEQMADHWIKDYKEGLDTIDGVCIRPGYIKLLLERKSSHQPIRPWYVPPFEQAMKQACPSTVISFKRTWYPTYSTF